MCILLLKLYAESAISLHIVHLLRPKITEINTSFTHVKVNVVDCTYSTYSRYIYTYATHHVGNFLHNYTCFNHKAFLNEM